MDVLPLGQREAPNCQSVTIWATTKNRYRTIQITRKSFLLLLLIRCHHIYDGLHQQELSHPVPKAEKGKGGGAHLPF